MTPALRRYDGLRRIAWAVLSAGLCGLSGRAIRAGGAFIAAGYVGPAKAALSLATALLRASERADRVAFPKIRV